MRERGEMPAFGEEPLRVRLVANEFHRRADARLAHMSSQPDFAHTTGAEQLRKDELAHFLAGFRPRHPHR